MAGNGNGNGHQAVVCGDQVVVSHRVKVGSRRGTAETHVEVGFICGTERYQQIFGPKKVRSLGAFFVPSGSNGQVNTTSNSPVVSVADSW